MYFSFNFLLCVCFICACDSNIRTYKKNRNIKNQIDRITVNPEIFFNTTQLCHKYNYRSETHKIITEDGYFLSVFRIPGKGSPILFLHGLIDSSDSWLILGPKKSLAFQLADHGYDIWLWNVRGNRYSQGHSEKLTHKEYWSFTFEESGTFDLPASIDYILSETSQKQLTVIAFSQGTTIFTILCSMKPEYNSKINHAILLAPVTWFNNFKHPNAFIISDNFNPILSFVEHIQYYEFFAYDPTLSVYLGEVCNVSSPKREICSTLANFIFGLNVSHLSPEKLPIVTSHIPAGSSTKSIIHYFQGILNKTFRRFDYGPTQNQYVYSSPTPPDYDVSQITVPLSLFVSDDDWFSSVEDVKILQSNLKAPTNITVIDKRLEFSHVEFVYGSRVRSLINKPVINIVRKLKHSKQ